MCFFVYGQQLAADQSRARKQACLRAQSTATAGVRPAWAELMRLKSSVREPCYQILRLAKILAEAELVNEHEKGFPLKNLWDFGA